MCNGLNGMDQPPSRQGRLSRLWRCRARELGGRRLPVGEFAGGEHRMHDDGELTGYSDSRAFEADLIAKFHAPAA